MKQKITFQETNIIFSIKFDISYKTLSLFEKRNYSLTLHLIHEVKVGYYWDEKNQSSLWFESFWEKICIIASRINEKKWMDYYGTFLVRTIEEVTNGPIRLALMYMNMHDERWKIETGLIRRNLSLFSIYKKRVYFIQFLRR